MNRLLNYLADVWHATVAGWNRFFFTPTDPATIGFIRICAGTMMFYTHLVWSLRLDDFFGSHAWVTQESARDAIGLQHRLAWSFWWLVDSPTLMWTIHAVVLVVMAMYALGLFTRVTTVLSVLAAISYVNRTPGALFGLDQLNIMLGLYLCLAPAGDAYSLDRWLQSKRLGKPLPPAEPSTSANLATRLIQLHMCVIYFFAGLSKLQGSTWWSGDALWLGFANYEYQSLDMTWTAAYPLASALLTTVTVYWELLFCAIVWPKLTRPLVCLVAIPLHMGIAVCLGMITFGTVMLFGVASFIPPEFMRSILDRRSRAGEGSPAPVVRVKAKRS